MFFKNQFLKIYIIYTLKDLPYNKFVYYKIYDIKYITLLFVEIFFE